MNDRLEMLDRTSWEAFLAAPRAVLMLGKTDCAACNTWTEELSTFLDTDEEFSDVRFGKLLLDQPGLVAFKRAHDWVAGVTDLPYNVIFIDGERAKEFAGGGADRLANRLRRVVG
jgi:hypothetical protein